MPLVRYPERSASRKAKKIIAEVMEGSNTKSKKKNAVDYEALMMKLFALSPQFDRNGKSPIPGALLHAIWDFDEAHGKNAFAWHTLPMMIEAAAQFFDFFPEGIPVVTSTDDPAKAHIVFTKHQCFCVLSCAFLCWFLDPPKVPRDLILLPINFDEMHFAGVAPRQNSVEAAKLRMHMEYLHETAARVLRKDAKLDNPQSTVIFIRRKCTEIPSHAFEMQLRKCVIHPLHKSIDDQKEMLRVDFANCCIGGGALSFGCVQEEIMFSICPELAVSILLFPPMEANEAIVILRAEQFSCVKPGTYGFSLQYGGPFVDSKMESSAITCIDAMDFAWGFSAKQYDASAISREVVKTFAGFFFDDQQLQRLRGVSSLNRDAMANLKIPAEIATGNWGCGAFAGDPKLKIMLQWIAAVMARKEMHYFPWDHSALLEFQTISDDLVAAGVTCRELYELLCSKAAEISPKEDLFKFVAGTLLLSARQGPDPLGPVTEVD